VNKGLRVLGHPLHAVLSDFPLALLISSLLWDAVGFWHTETAWTAMAFWSIVLGLLAAMLAAFAGAVDYAALPAKHPGMGTAMRHMVVMLAALAPFIVVAVIRRGPAAPSTKVHLISLGLESLGAGLLSLGGWYGGHLVFHYGVGGDKETAADEVIGE